MQRNLKMRHILGQSVEKEWSGITCSALAGFHQNSGFLNVMVT